jgi:cytochrome P450
MPAQVEMADCRGPGLPAAAQIALWAFRPVPFLTDCARRFGDTFTIRFPKYPPLVFTSDPGVVADVFSGDPQAFLTGQGNRILKPLLGEESLLLLDGEHHRKRRRLVMPPFHGPALRAAGDAMEDVADRHLERWPAGQAFPVLPALAALTLEVIVETVVGVRERERRDTLCAALTRLLSLGTRPAVFFLIGRDGESSLRPSCSGRSPRPGFSRGGSARSPSSCTRRSRGGARIRWRRAASSPCSCKRGARTARASPTPSYTTS